MLHPKQRRYLRQTLLFGFVWLFAALLYSLLEYGLLGNLEYYPSTGNRYDFQSSLLFTAIASFGMGLVQGWIEVTWLRQRFQKHRLWVKLVLKSLFYLSLIIFFLVLLTLITNAARYGSAPWDGEVLSTLWNFISRFSFWSVFLYIAAILSIALFFSEIGQYMGLGMLSNYMTGKYHRPKQEIRIFMFLDMKSSTTIAENLGHEKYFRLLKAYYGDMTNAILETSGEIYHYVGDEIVVSWTESLGLYKNNCIRCFYKISKSLEKRRAYYETTFGLLPDFKAGFHLGEVTTGELGIIKKDIIYTGDVLNTTARIQSLCNTYNVRVLISNKLGKRLQPTSEFSMESIGQLFLKGKKKAVQLNKLLFAEP